MADTLSVLKYYLYYEYKKRFSDRGALEQRQVQKIKKHLEYVGEHSRLYKGVRRLSSYPVVDKKFMMEHFDELNIVRIDREEALEFAVLAERQRNFSSKLEGVTVGLSSGTSGKQGIFLVSDSEKSRWAGYILIRFLPGNLFETHFITFFMRTDSSLYQAVRSKNIQFHFFGIYKDMEEHRKRLEGIRPRILAEQPSFLLMIAEDIREGKANVCPRIVISIAGVLKQANEQRVEKAFGLSIIHQVYQYTGGYLAATCSIGTLHLGKDIVYVEQEYLDNRRFVPVVTDLERKVQPIIRYRLNNILVGRKEPCDCGSPFLALKKMEGREDDMFSFKGKDGRSVPVFPDFIGKCILFEDKDSGENQAGSFGDYRIVQEAGGHLTVYADMTDPGKQRVSRGFELLPKDCGFLLPGISFQSYSCEKGGKMRRVERRDAEPVRGGCI